MSRKTKWLASLHLSCHQVLGLNWKMNLLVWKNTYLAEQQAHKGVIQRTSGGLGRSWHWLCAVDTGLFLSPGGSYAHHVLLWKLGQPEGEQE